MPLFIASTHNITLIGRHMGTLLEIEPLPFGVACSKLVRIKVEFDASMPLKTTFQFPWPSGILEKIYFKYEELFDFCYCC